MRPFMLLFLSILFTKNVLAQKVVVELDEQAIEKGIQLGMDRLEGMLANVNLNLAARLDLREHTQMTLDGPQKSKTLSKNFPVNGSDKVVLSNQYGSMQIKTWDKKEVKVEVTVRAAGGSEAEAQQLLDGVDIEAVKQGDQVIVKTKMNQVNLNFSRKRGRIEVKVDYVIYMPLSNDLTLSQNYGNVNVEDLSGALYAKVQYGNFSASNLKSNNNYISVQYGKTDVLQLNKAVIKHQYGSGLNIGTAGGIDLDAQYAAVRVNTIRDMASIKQQYGSGLTIGSTGQLDLDIQYASATINSVKGNAKINQQYSNLTMGTVGNLDLRAQYTPATIGTLRGNANISMRYNGLVIDEVTSSCKSLVVDGGYLNINLGFDSGVHADFEVSTRYGAFRYGDSISAKLLSDRNSNAKSYSGTVGRGGEAKIKVKSDYGSVTFK